MIVECAVLPLQGFINALTYGTNKTVLNRYRQRCCRSRLIDDVSREPDSNALQYKDDRKVTFDRNSPQLNVYSNFDLSYDDTEYYMLTHDDNDDLDIDL